MNNGQALAYLDGDVPSSNDGNPLGLLLELEEPIARDAVLRTLDVRLRRPSSDGDDDPPRFEPVLLPGPLPDHELVLVDEAGVAGVVVDSVLVEVLFVNAVEPVNVGISLLLARRSAEGDRLGGWGRVEAGE
jgi:hypothetical protein